MAKENEAELVLFPETITTGFSPGMGTEELWDLVDTVPGRITEPIAQAARNLGVHGEVFGRVGEQGDTPSHPPGPDGLPEPL